MSGCRCRCATTGVVGALEYSALCPVMSHALAAAEQQRDGEARESVRAERVQARVDRFLEHWPAGLGHYPLTGQIEMWAARLAAGRLGGSDEQPVRGEDPERGLVLWLAGEFGTGKTCAAWAACEHALRAGWPGMPLIMTGYQFQETVAPPVDYPGLHRMEGAALLVLDDLAAGRFSAWDQDKLAAVIDARSLHRRPMIITTNAGNLGEIVGKRSADRLHGLGITKVAFGGPSWRRAQ